MVHTNLRDWMPFPINPLIGSDGWLCEGVPWGRRVSVLGRLPYLRGSWYLRHFPLFVPCLKHHTTIAIPDRCRALWKHAYWWSAVRYFHHESIDYISGKYLTKRATTLLLYDMTHYAVHQRELTLSHIFYLKPIHSTEKKKNLDQASGDRWSARRENFSQGERCIYFLVTR